MMGWGEPFLPSLQPTTCTAHVYNRQRYLLCLMNDLYLSRRRWRFPCFPSLPPSLPPTLPISTSR